MISNVDDYFILATESEGGFVDDNADHSCDKTVPSEVAKNTSFSYDEDHCRSTYNCDCVGDNRRVRFYRQPRYFGIRVNMSVAQVNSSSSCASNSPYSTVKS